LPPDQEPRTPRRHSAPDRTRARSSATKAETAGRGEDPTRQNKGEEEPDTQTRTEREEGSQPKRSSTTGTPQATEGKGDKETGAKEATTGTAGRDTPTREKEDTGPPTETEGTTKEKEEDIGKPHRKKRRTPTQGRNQHGTHEDAQPGGSQTPTKTPQGKRNPKRREPKPKRKGGPTTKRRNKPKHTQQTDKQTNLTQVYPHPNLKKQYPPSQYNPNLPRDFAPLKVNLSTT